MDLTFTLNTEGKWECEFEATADFNLHLERKSAGVLEFYQTTVQGGKYAKMKDSPKHGVEATFDAEFVDGQVFPKYIKIESVSEPTMGVVTFVE